MRLDDAQGEAEICPCGSSPNHAAAKSPFATPSDHWSPLPLITLCCVSSVLFPSVVLTLPTSIISPPPPLTINSSTTIDSTRTDHSASPLRASIEIVSRLLFTKESFESTLLHSTTTSDDEMEFWSSGRQIAHGWEDPQATSPPSESAQTIGVATNHR